MAGRRSAGGRCRWCRPARPAAAGPRQRDTAGREHLCRFVQDDDLRGCGVRPPTCQRRAHRCCRTSCSTCPQSRFSISPAAPPRAAGSRPSAHQLKSSSSISSHFDPTRPQCAGPQCCIPSAVPPIGIQSANSPRTSGNAHGPPTAAPASGIMLALLAKLIRRPAAYAPPAAAGAPAAIAAAATPRRCRSNAMTKQDARK